MTDMGQAREKLEQYLAQVVANGRFDLQYTVTSAEDAATESSPGSENGAVPDFAVNFTGADVALLTARNGELLHAIESVAADILGLEPGQHHRLAFDADGFRAERARSLEQAVEQACEGVRRSGRPHAFPPMNSRERRLIHLAAARLGVQTSSTGEGPRRSVVLYPAGQAPPPEPSFNNAFSPSLPGERRSRPASSGRERGGRPPFGGDDRGNRFGSPRPSRPPFDPQQVAPGEEPAATGPSAEDRARAIRERFRKR